VEVPKLLLKGLSGQMSPCAAECGLAELTPLQRESAGLEQS